MQIGMCHDLFDFLLIQYDAGMPECRNRRAVTVEGFIAGQEAVSYTHLDVYKRQIQIDFARAM